MAKKYSKKTKRSRRKSQTRLRGKVVGIREASIQFSLDIGALITGLGQTIERVKPVC